LNTFVIESLSEIRLQLLGFDHSASAPDEKPAEKSKEKPPCYIFLPTGQGEDDLSYGSDQHPH
jgi:hypothetical protein